MRAVPLGLRAIAAALAVAASAYCSPALGSSAAATRLVVYVGSSGSDAGVGTRRRPFGTIGAALARARPGTTIVVRAGTYPSRIEATRSGTVAAPIVVRPASGARPVITGLLDVHASHLVFSGFRFVGRTTSNPDGVLVSIEGDDVTLVHNELRNAAMSGVIVGDSTNVRIVSNWIHDNGTHTLNGIPQDHGIYLSGSTNAVIANNIIDHNLGFGIHLYPRAVSTLVTCNTIVANGAAAGSRAAGIVVGGSESRGNTIVNNIFAWNGQTAARSLEPVGTGNTVFNNLAYADGTGDFPAAFSTGLTVRDNVVAPPRFVDPARRDYALRARSAALGRALASFLPISDFSGRPRLAGRRSALGALQRR